MTLEIVTIGPHIRLLHFRFGVLEFHNLQSTFSSRQWKQCVSSYKQDLVNRRHPMAGPMKNYLCFTAMSLLIANAYLCNVFGARIYSSYCKQLLVLATVMYVDNTNLNKLVMCALLNSGQTYCSHSDRNLCLGRACHCNRCCNETPKNAMPTSWHTGRIVGGQN